VKRPSPAITSIAVIALYNERGEVLLQHRTKDAPVLPDYWGFFGGSLEANETPEEAVRREAMEELSYRLRRPKLVATKQITHAERHFLLCVFVERYDGSELVLGEGQGLGWFFPRATDHLLMIEHDRVILNTVENAIKAEQA
jgi:8-oxo-dGTP diphosphatase